MAVSPDPTILIKKSDGTTERVSLAEFKLRQKNPPPKPAPPVAPSVPAPLTKTDTSSLLEEPAPALPLGTKLSDDRSDQVDAILKKLSFSVAPDLANRLRSLVQLRLKDIRSAEDTKAFAVRPIATGGLGLDEVAANELVKLSGAERHEVQLPKALRNAPLVPTASAVNLPVAYHAAGLPTVTAATRPPLEPLLVERRGDSDPLPFQKGEGRVRSREDQSTFQKPTPINLPISEKFKLNTSAVKIKPITLDISVPSVSMGPLEELAALTITDFRRLASDPQAATIKLAQKFTDLKDESIILYFQAVEAWRTSPLYQEYSNSLIKSLADNQPLDMLLRDKKSIHLTELTALVELEKQLH